MILGVFFQNLRSGEEVWLARVVWKLFGIFCLLLLLNSALSVFSESVLQRGRLAHWSCLGVVLALSGHWFSLKGVVLI